VFAGKPIRHPKQPEKLSPAGNAMGMSGRDGPFPMQSQRWNALRLPENQEKPMVSHAK
jgi:hypothetical protein